MSHQPKPNSDVTSVEPLTGGLNYRRWAAKIIMLLEGQDVDYIIYADSETCMLPTAILSVASHVVQPQDKDKQVTEKEKGASEGDNQVTVVITPFDPKTSAPQTAAISQQAKVA